MNAVSGFHLSQVFHLRPDVNSDKPIRHPQQNGAIMLIDRFHDRIQGSDILNHALLRDRRHERL